MNQLGVTSIKFDMPDNFMKMKVGWKNIKYKVFS